MTTKTVVILAVVLAAAILGAGLLMAQSVGNIQLALQPSAAEPATAPPVVAVPSDDTGVSNTLSVYSNGLVTIPPDKATMSIYLNLQGDSAEQVRGSLSTATTAVVDGAKQLGIDAADIITQGYNISADSYGKYDGSTTAYGNTSISITIRDLANVSKMIDLATTATGYSSCYYNFDVEEKADAYNLAIDRAAEEAREKAEKIAASMGKTVGGIVSIEEYEGYGSPLRSNITSDMASASGMPVESGSVEVRASLRVIFELVD